MTSKLCFSVLQFLSSKYFILFSAWSLQSALGVENEGDNPIEWLKNSIPGTIIRHTHRDGHRWLSCQTSCHSCKHRKPLFDAATSCICNFLGGPIICLQPKFGVWLLVTLGEPDTDYPILAGVQQTAFSCDGLVFGGYYADPETRCQQYSVCLQVIDS